MEMSSKSLNLISDLQSASLHGRNLVSVFLKTPLRCYQRSLCAAVYGMTETVKKLVCSVREGAACGPACKRSRSLDNKIIGGS
jgi:hypothetical protein